MINIITIITTLLMLICICTASKKLKKEVSSNKQIELDTSNFKYLLKIFKIEIVTNCYRGYREDDLYDLFEDKFIKPQDKFCEEIPKGCEGAYGGQGVVNKQRFLIPKTPLELVSLDFYDICVSVQKDKRKVNRENYPIFFNMLEFLVEVYKSNTTMLNSDKVLSTANLISEYKKTIQYGIKEYRDLEYNKSQESKVVFEKISETRFRLMEDTLKAIRNE